MPLVGARRAHQARLLGAALMMAMFDPIRAAASTRGVREVELSWASEDNRPDAAHIAEHMGGCAYKRCRLYEMDLWCDESVIMLGRSGP